MVRCVHLRRPRSCIGFVDAQLIRDHRKLTRCRSDTGGTGLRSTCCTRRWCCAQAQRLPLPERSPGTILRVACVGDVHDQWSDVDAHLLDTVVQPDVVLFTGDYGNENVALVRNIAAYARRRSGAATSTRCVASVFGNHDAWYTASARRQAAAAADAAAGLTRRFGVPLLETKVEGAVREQLALLREVDVGYGVRTVHLAERDIGVPLSIVGGRPFSWGGPNWRYPRFYEEYFQVSSMEESAARIRACLRAEVERVWSARLERLEEERSGQATSNRHPSKQDAFAPVPCLGVHQVVFLAHNGPCGLGDEPHDICGRDFGFGTAGGTGFDTSSKLQGDFGCPDLADVIQSLKTKPMMAILDGEASVFIDVPLCVFGHMHEQLQWDPQGYGIRQMVVESHHTVYVNAAVVPRVRAAREIAELSGQASLEPGEQPFHNFTVIDMEQRACRETEAATCPAKEPDDALYRVRKVFQVWLSEKAPQTASYVTCLYESSTEYGQDPERFAYFWLR
jgi:predicted phosphodiesterase